MKNLKPTIGQVYLTHMKDSNYCTLYEESFDKNGTTVQLFMVMEITESRAESMRLRRAEYEKVAQAIVSAFKRTYSSSPLLDQDTFEKSLASVNAQLAKTAGQNRVNWYGKLNSVIAALHGNELSISSAGKGVAYLMRKGEFTQLTEDLADNDPKPIKIFSNFASGKIAHLDRLIISTGQLFNYLSIERIKDFLLEDVAEACQEIIENLREVKDAGFASFVCEFTSPSGKEPLRNKKNRFLPIQTEASGKLQTLQSVVSGKTANTAKKLLVEIAKGIYLYTKKIIIWVFNFIKSALTTNRKKALIAVIVIIAIVLVYSVVSAFRNRNNERDLGNVEARFASIENSLNEAEAALIYDDRNRVANLLTNASSALDELSELEGDETYQALRARLGEIENKINKEIISVEPKVLTQFSNIPTTLLRSPNGFLGFNENTGSVAFYDFRTGETKRLLEGRNTSDLSQGIYLNDAYGFVFLSKEEKWKQLDVSNNQLIELARAESETTLGRGQLASVFGEGGNARVYLVDTNRSAVWRTQYTGELFTAPEPWLEQNNVNFSEAVDTAIDGNIYVLYPNRLDRYFRGAKEGFTLSPVSPSLESADRIVTELAHQNIYITDSANQRILVYDKNGQVQKQFRSEAFRDLSDIYVDEGNGIIYAISGEQLMQFDIE